MIFFSHGCDALRRGAWLIALHQRHAQVKLKWPLCLKSFLLGSGRGLRNTSVESCVPALASGCDLKLTRLKPGIQYAVLQYHLNWCAVKPRGRCGVGWRWLRAGCCSSRTRVLLRDCMCREDCHALFVGFEERKTVLWLLCWQRKLEV